MVKLVPKQAYSQRDINLLLRECRARLGNDMEIDLRFVDSIARTSSGKFRAVISNLELCIIGTNLGSFHRHANRYSPCFCLSADPSNRCTTVSPPTLQVE